ncbi:MAG: response regulator [Myxococcales bacterium]|nr:response regulator [Myxococcales bacterium]MCB9709531.1 response regulator [Myxococcales bacterium]
MNTTAEILILDSLDRDREGLRVLFEKEGYLCTVVADASEARELIIGKFFPVAVVDLDFGGVGAGVDLCFFLREHSPATSIVMLTSRRSFEAAVQAMRLGVVDVIMKTPGEIPRLRATILKELDKQGSVSGNSDLLRTAQSVLEEAVKIMLEMGRSLYVSSDSSSQRRPRVLLVDNDATLVDQIRTTLNPALCELHIEMTGGAALDKALATPFDLVAVSEQLGDLPGTTVLKSLQNYHVETLGLLYSKQQGGHLDRYQAGQPAHVERPFGGAPHLLERVTSIAQEVGQLQRERGYIRAFRRHHETFLRRYADLKIRIDNVRSGMSP